MTIGNFVKAGLLEVGQMIVLENGGTIVIGDATLYHEDSENDGGFGWDWSDDRVIKEVIKLVPEEL